MLVDTGPMRQKTTKMGSECVQGRWKQPHGVGEGDQRQRRAYSWWTGLRCGGRQATGGARGEGGDVILLYGLRRARFQGNDFQRLIEDTCWECLKRGRRRPGVDRRQVAGMQTMYV